MSANVRISLGTTQAIQNRMRELSEKFDVSQSKLIESLLLLPDEEIGKAINSGLVLLEQARQQRFAQKRALAKKLNSMSPEELARLT